MQTNYPDLRAWLYDQENFEGFMKKSAYACSIQDNEAIDAVQMLDINGKIQPSSIVIVMPDNSYKEFWQEVHDVQILDVCYSDRLASYSKYFLIY